MRTELEVLRIEAANPAPRKAPGRTPSQSKWTVDRILHLEDGRAVTNSVSYSTKRDAAHELASYPCEPRNPMTVTMSGDVVIGLRTSYSLRADA